MTTETHPVVHLDSYDRIIVCFSGGKDSLACLLYLLEQRAYRPTGSHYTIIW